MALFNATRLLNKTVLVTGASGGIGQATAVLFARAGSNVILTARRADALEAVKQQCIAAHQEGEHGAAGGKFEAIQLDVSDQSAVDGLLQRIPEKLRNVDILVNNAGFVYGREAVGEIKPEDVRAMFETNVLGLIHITQKFVKLFKERQAGHVINIGSIAGREPYVGGGIYCATKHAVKSFTGTLLRELAGTPIRVTEIQPGLVETNFSITRFRGDKSQADAVYDGMQPLVAEDVAEEIVWAASRPGHVNIAEVYVLPINQGSATIVERPKKQ